MRAPIALALLCFAAASAAEVTIKWLPPTHCENTIAIGEEGCPPLLEYRLQCSDDPGPPYDSFEWRVPASATSDDRSYPPGDYYCRISVSNAVGFSGRSVGEIFFSVAAPESAVPLPPEIVE